MNLLAHLIATDHPAVAALIDTHACRHDTGPGEITLDMAKFDNQPTWDNWNKSTPTPFNNQPTWDNWNKKK